jgi:hypothetical protein
MLFVFVNPGLKPSGIGEVTPVRLQTTAHELLDVGKHLAVEIGKARLACG